MIELDTCYGAFLYDEPAEYEDAIQAYDSFLEAHPDHYVARNNRGVLLWEIGEHKKAEADLVHACSKSTKDGVPYKNLGSFLRDHGETKKAITAYREALFRDPKDPSAYIGLGYLLVDERHLSEAVEVLSKAINLDGSLLFAYFKRADAYQALGNSEAAKKDRKKAAALKKRLKLSRQT